MNYSSLKLLQKKKKAHNICPILGGHQVNFEPGKHSGVMGIGLTIQFTLLEFNVAIQLQKVGFCMLLSKHVNNLQFLKWAKIQNMML